MSRVPRRLFGAAVAALLVPIALAVPGITPAATATSMCGPAGVALQPIKHIVVVMDENVSYSSIIGPVGSTAQKQAPFINQMATECGLATNYHAVAHPSHIDYIAATAGDRYVPSSCSSWSCVSVPLDKPSIFGQIPSAGRSWRVYAESMPSNCSTSSQDPYSPGHNPPVWFTPIAADCKKWDVPIPQLTTDLNNNALPTYSWIVPNKCNDMHNCSGQNPITAGDTFLKSWMAKIVATPDYQNGSTVVFVTWDEGVEGGRPFNEDCLATANLSDESCHVATIVASRWVTPGTRSSTLFSHYGLLKTAEKLMNLPYLAHAGDASTNDMIAAFGLGTGSSTQDTTPPTTPTNLTATAPSATRVDLHWTASTDNVGVDHYVVWRNGAPLPGATPSGTSYTDTTVSASTPYTYRVRAVDAAGNKSALSASVGVTTPATSPSVFSDDFESGTLSAWTNAGLVDQQQKVKSGVWAARGTSTANGGRSATAPLPGAPTDLWVDLDFQVVSHGANNVDLFKLRDGTANSIYSLSTSSSDKIISRNSFASTSRVSATGAATGVWHHAEVHLTVAGASGSVTVWLDGTLLSDASGAGDFGTSGLATLQLGDATGSRTFDVAFDNVVVHT